MADPGNDTGKNGALAVPPASEAVFRATKKGKGGKKKYRNNRMVPLETVLNSRESVARLSSQPVPTRVAARILRVAQLVNRIGDEFEVKRSELAARLGEAVAEGQWKIPSEKMGEFQAEIKKLIDNEEVTIDEGIFLTMDELDTARISAGDLERIEYLIRDM